MLKKCSKCNEEKELLEYNHDKYRPDGLRTACRVCNKLSHFNNKENNYKKAREYGLKNKEHLEEYRK